MREGEFGKPLFDKIHEADQSEVWIAVSGITRYKDEPIWIAKDGKVWKIEHMETRHLQNCLANILFAGLNRKAYVDLIIAELEKRGAGA